MMNIISLLQGEAIIIIIKSSHGHHEEAARVVAS